MNPTHRRYPVTDQRAFALLSTLLLLVLATILVVVLLTAVRVETRTADTFELHEQAQSNARYALELALAELQEQAGPDSRITATAAILDTDESTPTPDGVAHPHWTGIWDSWDTWLNARGDNPSTGTLESITDTYTKGRTVRFRRWLISGPDEAALENPDTPTSDTAIPETDQITLVGEGSLGPDPTPEDIVTAGLLEIPKDPSDADTVPSGRAAWWVGDEGTKARIDLARPASAAGSPAEAQFQSTDSPRLAPESLADLDTLSTKLDADPDLAARFLSKETIALAADDPDLALTQLKNSFHSITDSGFGVLADVRSGGLKKDLSLLLEHDHLPVPFAGISPADTSPLRPYEDLPGSIYPPNFQSWYSLQQYYQLYRISSSWSPPGAPKNGNYLAYSGDQNHSDVDGGIFWTGDRPAIDYYLRGGVNELGSYRHWVVPKLEMVIYLQREPVPNTATSKYRLIYNPVATIWNPYNVPFRMPPIHFSYGRTPIRIKVFRNGIDQGWQEAPRYGIDVYFRNQYRPVGSADTTWIECEPGETRAFSPTPTRAEVQGAIEIYPGYNAGEGGWVGELFEGAPVPDLEKVEISLKMLSVANLDGGSIFPNTSPNGEYSPRANAWQLNYIPFPQDVMVIPEAIGERVEFPPAGDANRRPLALIRVALKSGQLTDSGDPDYPDYRNRFLIHANPTTHRPALNSPTKRFLTAAQYEVVGLRIRGELDRNLPQIAPDNRSSYVASGHDAAEGQTRWTYIEIPTAPLTSLGQLQHLRLEPGTRRWDSRTTTTIASSHLWDVSANQGYGIANSFAHPLIAGDAVYQEDSANRRNRSGVLQYDRLADTWDNSFLNNDALFDSYFFSGIAPQQTGSFPTSSQRTQRQVYEDFLTESQPLPTSRFAAPVGSNSDPAPVADLLFDGDAPRESAHEDVAANLYIKGAFNVNSTEPDAWRALLHGLKSRALAHFKPGSAGRNTTDPDTLTLSRFTLPNDDTEGAGPYDPATWNGVRHITDAQIDRLANEIVKQVKLRGPFLNMADFINRRLANDETGLRGALQAAIDYDELGGNTPDPTAADSINARHKGGDSMIPAAAVAAVGYTNPAAATGSRWAGAPGYLLQADLLTPLAPVIAPRSDTFRIRAYGEVLNRRGEVQSRAWCEAIVQRFPDYVMPSPEKDTDPTNGNHPAELPTQADGSPNPDMHPLNLRLGRRLKIIRFRWLGPEEI